MEGSRGPVVRLSGTVWEPMPLGVALGWQAELALTSSGEGFPPDILQVLKVTMDTRLGATVKYLWPLACLSAGAGGCPPSTAREGGRTCWGWESGEFPSPIAGTSPQGPAVAIGGCPPWRPHGGGGRLFHNGPALPPPLGPDLFCPVSSGLSPVNC